jgi:hypothetical protein
MWNANIHFDKQQVGKIQVQTIKEVKFNQEINLNVENIWA